MHPQPIHRFASREEAGRELAKRLSRFSNAANVIVLALPNGGARVGAEVAALLRKPFDVLFVEKITAPGCGGMRLGAITCGGVRTLNDAMIDSLHLSSSEVSTAVLQGSLKLARREKLCRGQHPSVDVADHTVILVDDGTTSRSIIQDAIRLLRRQHAEHIVVALPAASPNTVRDLRMEADEIMTLTEPTAVRTTGKWFKQFPRTTPADVRRLLAGENTASSTGN